jgi:cytochrome P450
MVGAVINEKIRLFPAILNIPKRTFGDQLVTVDGEELVIGHGTFVQISTVSTHRNLRYWPHSPSKKSKKPHDLDDFVPQRWLPKTAAMEKHVPTGNVPATDEIDTTSNVQQASYDTNTAKSLFKPVKSSFIAFSDGPRSCPGRRFAQVELTAVLTAIFSKYTVELDVSEWASDEEFKTMTDLEKIDIYRNAIAKAEMMLKRCEQVTITLQMKVGDKIPVRFVKRGNERFADLF